MEQINKELDHKLEQVCHFFKWADIKQNLYALRKSQPRRAAQSLLQKVKECFVVPGIF